MPRCRRNYPGPSSLPAKVRPQLAPKSRHGRSAALHHSAAQHRNVSSTATPALSNRPQVHSTAASASPQHHQRHSIAPRFVNRHAALQHQQPAASRPRAQHARMGLRLHSTHALASARAAVALTCPQVLRAPALPIAKLLPTALSLRASAPAMRQAPREELSRSAITTSSLRRRLSRLARSAALAHTNLIVASARAPPHLTATGRRWPVAGVNGTSQELSRSCR